MSKVLGTVGKVAGVVGAVALTLSTAGVGGAALATVAKIATATAAIPTLPAAVITLKGSPRDFDQRHYGQSFRVPDGRPGDLRLHDGLRPWPGVESDRFGVPAHGDRVQWALVRLPARRPTNPLERP